MQINIEINLDNDAYQEGYLVSSLKCNFERIAEAVDNGATAGIVKDYNGNTTGSWEIK